MSSYQVGTVLEILHSLESLSSGELRNMLDSQRYDPEFSQWLELSLLIRSLLVNGSPVSLAAQEWSKNHKGHPVTLQNFPDIVKHYGKLFPFPGRVAVLLPTSGGLAVAARAIRDGMLSAYLAQTSNTTIRFYSSGENSESAIEAYLRASLDGATQVIGPLRIESTHALAGLDKLNVPVLLLNEIPGRDVARREQINPVNSISLSQSEEAGIIARMALGQGQTQAIVIVPESPWGERIENAFTSVFEEGEGQVSAIAHFDTTKSDHSTVLMQLLKIDESKQRKADLQSQIGIPLVFEPHRRHDFDFIFMAASPAQGRELKPLLRFHDTGDAPVYAMARVFSGRIDPATDQDLNSVLFPITPWQLQTHSKVTMELESIRGGIYGDLYALGRDAWNILPWLPLMQKDPDLLFPGDTGNLWRQENGTLFRQPAWAQFSAGQPVEYEWPIN